MTHETAAAEGPVLVTGATGFLGREVVARLAARGTPVEVFARERSEHGALDDLPLVWHTGELRDAASVERAVAAISARARATGTRARLVHSAALISYRTEDRAEAIAINVEGTRHLLASAKRHAIGRFCFVSSVVAVGHAPRGGTLDERAPFTSAGLGVDYVTTKRAAEELVLAEKDALDVVVVNPGAIFGPAERRSNTVRFLCKVDQGRAPLFAPPGVISVLGVADAAEGTLLALEKGRRGERYLLVESSLSGLDLFRRIARALGSRETRFSVPRFAWPAIVAIARAVDRVRPLDLTPPQALTMLGCELSFDASKARTELGWNPRPFDEVLRETIATLRARRVLGPAP